MAEKILTIKANRGKIIKRIFIFCLGMELFIVFADTFLNFFKWIPYKPMRRVFNITREDGISNFFSSTQTLVTGAVLLLIFFMDRSEKKKWGWAFLAAFFAFMAVDDASKFHERVGSSFKLFAKSVPSAQAILQSYPSYAWQIVFGPFFVIVGLYMVWFLWKELNQASYKGWIAAALACLVLAVCLDLVEGMNLEALKSYPARHFQKLIEEFLEMFGNTLFLITFTSVLLNQKDRVEVQFE